jgi:predicted RND superfamily exporter protein
MLTTLTTFAGLSPMMVATSVQSQMLVPMAISLAFGVVVATAITLLLVPVIYLILDDVGRLLRGPRHVAIADAGHRQNEAWQAGRDTRTTIA